MDIKKLIEDLHGLLKQYGEKIPYGELVGAPCPYSRTGDLVWQDPEPYLIEQAANAITDLLERAEVAEARCKAFEKMVREYRDEIVPRYMEMAEKAERERDEAVETIFKWRGCAECKNWQSDTDWCEKHDRYATISDGCSTPEWRGIKEE